MFKVVGSEPSFDLSLRCGFSDASENMFDSMLQAVLVEGGFSSPHTPELTAMIRQCLSGFTVFMDGSIE